MFKPNLYAYASNEVYNDLKNKENEVNELNWPKSAREFYDRFCKITTGLFDDNGRSKRNKRVFRQKQPLCKDIFVKIFFFTLPHLPVISLVTINNSLTLFYTLLRATY